MRIKFRPLSLHACALGVIGLLMPACHSNTGVMPDVLPAPQNTMRTIMSVSPDTIRVGGSTSIQGTALGSDSGALEWSLSLDATSTAQGVFSSPRGTSSIASNFQATSAGIAVIRLTVSGGNAAPVTMTLRVTVTSSDGA